MGRNIKIGSKTLKNVDSVRFQSADDPTYEAEYKTSTDLITAMFQDTGVYITVSAVVEEDGSAILYTDKDMSNLGLSKPQAIGLSCLCMLVNENWDSVTDKTLAIEFESLMGKPYYGAPRILPAEYTTTYNVPPVGTNLYNSEYPNEDTGLYSMCKLTAANYKKAWNTDGLTESKTFRLYHFIPPMRHLNYTLDDTVFNDSEVVVNE